MTLNFKMKEFNIITILNFIVKSKHFDNSKI
jgi:hypothetical protein